MACLAKDVLKLIVSPTRRLRVVHSPSPRKSAMDATRIHRMEQPSENTYAEPVLGVDAERNR
jgi:hypothetical protein